MLQFRQFVKIGACGIAREVCGYFAKVMYEDCVAGNGEGTTKKLEIHEEKLGLNCPVLECTFDRRVGYCFNDYDKFPCEVLCEGFSYTSGLLDIFKRKVGKSRKCHAPVAQLDRAAVS